LVNEIKKKYPGKEVYYFSKFEDIATFVADNSSSGDLVITMGAGDIYKVAEMILEKGTPKGSIL
jgi:UDP-N-acetylmuramate--alanine ligase